MLIRDATAADWPEIWAIVREVVEAGDTFSWDRGISEEQARSMWLHERPGECRGGGRGKRSRTFVAVDETGLITGTAELHRNQGGGGSHVANAGFMVPKAQSGRGIGRALAAHVIEQARADGFLAMQFNAVVAANVRAVELWKSLGFEVLAAIPDGFLHPSLGYVDLLVMYRDL